MHEEVLSTGETIILLIIVQVLLPVAPFNKRDRVDFLQGGSSGGAGETGDPGSQGCWRSAAGHLGAERASVTSCRAGKKPGLRGPQGRGKGRPLQRKAAPLHDPRRGPAPTSPSPPAPGPGRAGQRGPPSHPKQRGEGDEPGPPLGCGCSCLWLSSVGAAGEWGL